MPILKERGTCRQRHMNFQYFILLQYEHKVYGTKKTRTELLVSVSGIKVVRKEDVKRGWITHHVIFLLNKLCHV